MIQFYPVIISKGPDGRLIRKIVQMKFTDSLEAKSKAKSMQSDGDFATFAPVEFADSLIADSRVGEVIGIDP
jgi:hypothetical protein